MRRISVIIGCDQVGLYWTVSIESGNQIKQVGKYRDRNQAWVAAVHKIHVAREVRHKKTGKRKSD